MKKISVFLYFLVFSLFILHAQTDIAKIYETFSWTPTASAKKYEIIIERQNGNDWEPYYSTTVKENNFEHLFEPSIYRIGIVSINSLGRKSKDINWMKFQILDEKVPYLFNFENNNLWNSPVLFIKNGTKTPDPNDIYITADSLMPENSFCVKGKNIFYEGTLFNLVPIEKSLSSGKDFPEIKPGRKIVPLEIIQRDSRNNKVNLQYQAKNLKSGYYKLEAVNPGGFTTQLSILVLTTEALKIKPLENNFSDKYNVSTIETGKNKPLEISLKGEGLSEETVFYLEPAEGQVEYLFESNLEREKIDLGIDVLKENQDSGETEIILKQNVPARVKPGYYNIVAENPDGQKESQQVLIETVVSEDENHNSKVNDITTKTNLSKKTIELTLKGNNLDTIESFTLISQYFDSIRRNEKIEISPEISKNGKQAKVVFPLSSLPVGKYVLLLESSDDSYPVYFEIEPTFSAKILKETPQQVEQWISPSTTSVVKQEDTTNNKSELNENNEKSELSENENLKDYVINDHEWIAHLLPEYYFNKLKFSMSFIPDYLNYSGFNLQFGFDLNMIEYSWLSAGVGIRANPFLVSSNIFNPYVGVSLFADFGWPMGVVYPFAGLETGYYVLDSLNNDIWLKNDLYAGLRLGVFLFDHLEFRYNLELHNISTVPHFKDSYSIGYKFRIKPKKYEMELGKRAVEFLQTDEIDGNTYKDDLPEIFKIEFEEGLKIISNFNSNSIREVYLPNTIEEIRDNVFAGCENLEIVSIEGNKLFYIGKKAFADCKKLKSINIPRSISVIEENAFENWSNGQEIHLGWDSQDSTPRSLDGLKGIKARVLYSDGVLYDTGVYINPLMEESAWPHKFNLNQELDNFYNSSLFEDGEYKHVLFGSETVNKDFSGRTHWTEITSPSDLVKELINSDGLEFTIMSSPYSNTEKFLYNVILVTKNKGIFTYPFEVPLNYGSSRKTKTVTARLSDFVPAHYSPEKNLNKEDIVYFGIAPYWSSDAWITDRTFIFYLKDVHFIQKETVDEKN